MRSGIIFLLILVFSSLTFCQQNIKEFQRKLDILLGNDFFDKSTASVNIYDLTSDTSLYELNIKKLLTPASNQKIITSVSALIYLGADYKFATSMYYTGKQEGSVLNGDIYIIGGCDPLFTTNDLSWFVKRLKLMGIKGINGNIYADVSMKDSLFWGDGWMWDDDPSSDAPYLSALNINGNCVDVKVLNKAEGERPDIIIQPKTKFVSLINNAVCGSDIDSSDYRVTRDWINRVNNIYVYGTIPAKKIIQDTIETKINIFNPSLYFLTMFKERLQASGINVEGKLKINNAPGYAKNLLIFYRPLDTVIVNMNKVSDNLSAEMLLYAMAFKYSGPHASAKKGTTLIDSLITLSGLNPQNYKIADGSGVSRYNLVSTELLLDVLKYVYSKPLLFGEIFKSFPIAGMDGTLKNRMKNSSAESNIHAKTGTLSGVSCLSGYGSSENGHLLAFSIIIQNYVDDDSLAKYYIDEICKVISNY